MKRHLFCVLVANVALVGCSEQEPSITSQKATIHVTRQEMGNDWPLTVADGEVSCDGTKDWGRLYFERDGKRYALNGAAMMDEGKTPDIFKSGWQVPDPVIPQSYKSVAPLQNKARSACK